LPCSTLFPYTTLFRSAARAERRIPVAGAHERVAAAGIGRRLLTLVLDHRLACGCVRVACSGCGRCGRCGLGAAGLPWYRGVDGWRHGSPGRRAARQFLAVESTDGGDGLEVAVSRGAAMQVHCGLNEGGVTDAPVGP